MEEGEPQHRTVGLVDGRSRAESCRGEEGDEPSPELLLTGLRMTLNSGHAGLALSSPKGPLFVNYFHREDQAAPSGTHDR